MKVLMFVVAVALAVALGGCANVNRSPSSYTSSVRRNFLHGCEQQSERDGVRRPQAMCTCAYDRLRSSLPFGEFRDLNDRLTDRPAPLPREVLRLFRACQE